MDIIDYNKLPTSKEYRNSITIPEISLNKWSEPKYQCPNCGGECVRT